MEISSTQLPEKIGVLLGLASLILVEA